MLKKKQMIKVVVASLLSVGLLAACGDMEGNDININDPNTPNDPYPNEETNDNTFENEDNNGLNVNGPE